MGLGGLGTNAVQIAKNVLGAKRVLASDLKKESLDLALSLGADEVFDARTLVQDVRTSPHIPLLRFLQLPPLRSPKRK